MTSHLRNSEQTTKHHLRTQPKDRDLRHDAIHARWSSQYRIAQPLFERTHDQNQIAPATSIRHHRSPDEYLAKQASFGAGIDHRAQNPTAFDEVENNEASAIAPRGIQ